MTPILTLKRIVGLYSRSLNPRVAGVDETFSPLLLICRDAGDALADDEGEEITLDVATECSYTVSVRYEWDEAKRQSNIQKHGIDFIGIESLFDGETVTIRDDRFDYEEARLITVGMLKGRVVVVAHTETDEVIRIISVRKATKNEEINYLKQIAD